MGVDCTRRAPGEREAQRRAQPPSKLSIGQSDRVLLSDGFMTAVRSAFTTAAPIVAGCGTEIEEMASVDQALSGLNGVYFGNGLNLGNGFNLGNGMQLGNGLNL